MGYKVLIKTPKLGPDNLLELEVEANDTVLQLKEKMIRNIEECKMHIPKDLKPYLPANPKEDLDESRTLASYGIAEGSKIYYIVFQIFEYEGTGEPSSSDSDSEAESSDSDAEEDDDSDDDDEISSDSDDDDD